MKSSSQMFNWVLNKPLIFITTVRAHSSSNISSIQLFCTKKKDWIFDKFLTVLRKISRKTSRLELYLERETPTQFFSCKFCKIFEITYFIEHLRTAVSAFWGTDHSKRYWISYLQCSSLFPRWKQLTNLGVIHFREWGIFFTPINTSFFPSYTKFSNHCLAFITMFPSWNFLCSWSVVL